LVFGETAARRPFCVVCPLLAHSGHRLLRRTCPLMTQGGHGSSLNGPYLNRYDAHVRSLGGRQ
jgi:hypothetical protein